MKRGDLRRDGDPREREESRREVDVPAHVGGARPARDPGPAHEHRDADVEVVVVLLPLPDAEEPEVVPACTP